MKSFIAIKPGTTRNSFLTPENIELLKSFGEVRFIEGELSKDNIIAQIGDSEVYVTAWGSPKLDGDILAAAPNLKMLSHLCGTVAAVVTDEMWEKDIKVISGNDFFAESTAEGAIAYIMCAQRDLLYYATDFKNNGKWKKADYYTRSLLGKTVGVISYGTVAKNVVRMLTPFRTKTLVYDIAPVPEEDKLKYNIEQVSLEELFTRSDIITVHTPLNDATYHMIGRELLEKIKPDALFVNESRGEIVNQKELEEILATGRFRAALDVFEKEPPEPDCPLFRMPNVMMTPHMGGPTFDLRPEIAENVILDSHRYIDEGRELKYEIKRARAKMMSKH